MLEVGGKESQLFLKGSPNLRRGKPERLDRAVGEEKAHGRRSRSALHPSSLANFLAEKSNRFVGAGKRPVVGTTAGLPQTVIDGASLGRCVLVVRVGQLGDNVDHSTGYLELHLLPALQSGTPPNAPRHYQFRLR